MQCFCFLTTKDHFSSNWTSWVAGGKSRALVVALPGVGSGPQGVADDGVFSDADQARGLANPAAVWEVLEDSAGLVVRESRAEPGGALALREALLTGATGEQAPSALAVAEADAEMAATTQALVRAVGVLAAEEVEVFPECYPHTKRAYQWTTPCFCCRTAAVNWQRYGDTTQNPAADRLP